MSRINAAFSSVSILETELLLLGPSHTQFTLWAPVCVNTVPVGPALGQTPRPSDLVMAPGL